MNGLLLSAEAVSKSYPAPRASFGARLRVQALTRVSLSVTPGERVALVGESGCGKSTLARLLAGLELPSSGRVVVSGRAARLRTLGERRAYYRQVQLVLQDPHAALNPRKRVRGVLRAPLEALLHEEKSEHDKRIRETLSLVELDHELLGRFPHELSGGEAQRVTLARALLVRPRIVILDEAVAALDVSVKAQVLDLLRAIQRETRVSYLFISHELGVVDAFAERVLVMYCGRIVESGPTAQVFGRPEHPYTSALISAVPEPGERRIARRIRLAGDPASPISIPGGCAFHPRCPRADGICSTQVPELKGEDRQVACHHPLP